MSGRRLGGGLPFPHSLSLPSTQYFFFLNIFFAFFFSFLYQTAATFRQIGRRPLNTKEADLLFLLAGGRLLSSLLFFRFVFVYQALAASLAASLAEASFSDIC